MESQLTSEEPLSFQKEKMTKEQLEKIHSEWLQLDPRARSAFCQYHLQSSARLVQEFSRTAQLNQSYGLNRVDLAADQACCEITFTKLLVILGNEAEEELNPHTDQDSVQG